MQNLIELVKAYGLALQLHPMKALVEAGKVPSQTLDSFAHLHFLFSSNWGTVIGTVKDVAKNPAFLAALKTNMGDELGAEATSHVTLCRRFLLSQKLVPTYGTGLHVPQIAALPMTLMDSLPDQSEAFAAGYMVCSETIIPDMFQLFLPAFKNRGADCEYLKEHLVADPIRHSKMLFGAVESILAEGGNEQDVIHGIHLGGRSIVTQADFFFAQAVAINTAG